MLKIDIHTHILPPTLPEFKKLFGYGGFIELRPCAGCRDLDMYEDSGKFFRRIKENCYDPEVRVRECDLNHVHVQVLSTVPTMFSYWAKPEDGLALSKVLNDHLSEVVKKNPKRFVGLGTVPLQDPRLAVKEVERGMTKLGFRGFQIGSHVNSMNLDDKALFPFYEACEALDACLFVHPWDMMGQEKMAKYWLPWLVGMPAETSLAICSMIFGGIFQKFPKLRVAFAHGGGSYPITAGRIQHGYESRPDLCAIDCKISPEEQKGKFYFDSLVHDPLALKYLIDFAGADRICLGTDYPFPLGEQNAGKLIEDTIKDSKTREWLYHQSALNWLGMRKEFFIKD